MTAEKNGVVLTFTANDTTFNILVTTKGTEDHIEDIWADICSFIYNVPDAEECFEEVLDEIFEEYPDYEYYKFV